MLDSSDLLGCLFYTQSIIKDLIRSLLTLGLFLSKFKLQKL